MARSPSVPSSVWPRHFSWHPRAAGGQQRLRHPQRQPSPRQGLLRPRWVEWWEPQWHNDITPHPVLLPTVTHSANDNVRHQKADIQTDGPQWRWSLWAGRLIRYWKVRTPIIAAPALWSWRLVLTSFNSFILLIFGIYKANTQVLLIRSSSSNVVAAQQNLNQFLCFTDGEISFTLPASRWSVTRSSARGCTTR